MNEEVKATMCVGTLSGLIKTLSSNKNMHFETVSSDNFTSRSIQCTFFEEKILHRTSVR